MFCRHCYYDLRGQDTPRCPECGTTFLFDDPDTFLAREPGAARRFLLRLRRHRMIAVVASTVLLLLAYAGATYLLPPSQRQVHAGIVSAVNLKMTVTTWMIQQYEHPQQTTFDIEAAKRDMRPSLSAWSERKAARYRFLMTYFLRVAPYYAIPTLAYLLILVVFAGRRLRRTVVVLILALSFVLLLAAVYPQKVTAFLSPGSHAFLNDYAYVSNVHVGSGTPQQGRTIAAYDVRSFRRPGRRLIAFADGHTEWLSDERAKPLFEAQGLPYPGQSE